MIILAPIRFLGRHAPLVLPFGIILALLIPETTRDLNQFVPWLIVIIYSMTMIRINILQIFVQAIQPRYMMRNLAISLFILVFSPVLIFTLCRVIGVDEVLIPISTMVCPCAPDCLDGLDVRLAWFQHGSRHTGDYHDQFYRTFHRAFYRRSFSA